MHTEVQPTTVSSQEFRHALAPKRYNPQACAGGWKRNWSCFFRLYPTWSKFAPLTRTEELCRRPRILDRGEHKIFLDICLRIWL